MDSPVGPTAQQGEASEPHQRENAEVEAIIEWKVPNDWAEVPVRRGGCSVSKLMRINRVVKGLVTRGSTSLRARLKGMVRALHIKMLRFWDKLAARRIRKTRVLWVGECRTVERRRIVAGLARCLSYCGLGCC